MFCLTLEPNHYKFIKELGYIPVGLGEKESLNFESLRCEMANVFKKIQHNNSEAIIKVEQFILEDDIVPSTTFLNYMNSQS